MNEMETDAFLEKLKRSVMADPDHSLKAKIRAGQTVSGNTGKVHGVTKTITLSPDDVPGDSGLRSIENGTTYGAGLLTMGCYYVTGGNWGYTSTLYSGISGNTIYYTTGS